MNLKMEKNLAVLEWDQNHPLILSNEERQKFRSYIQKIIKSPSVHIALLIFKNTQNPEMFFESTFIKALKKNPDREKWERLLDEAHELFNLIESANVSWISTIHGACLGHQLELALTCDYRIATFNKDTVFGFPEIHFGLIPGFGGCIRLPRLIGVQKALKMILESQIISARSAYHIRLMDYIVHPLDVEKQARALAEQIARGQIPPKPPRKYKPLRLIDKFFEIPMNQQILYHRTKKKILTETKGFYPAPLKALEVIKKTYPAKFLKTALKEESNSFCDLTVSSVTRHLISLDNTHRQKKDLQAIKVNPTPTTNTPIPTTNKIFPQKKIQKVAVVGAGIMGEGITHYLTKGHIPVLLKDIHPPSLTSALKSIHSIWNKQTQTNWLSSLLKKFLSEKTNDEKSTPIKNHHPLTFKNNYTFIPNIKTQPSNKQSYNTLISSVNENKIRFRKIRPQLDYSGFQNVDLVIETVVEDLEIKKKVIAETAQHLSSTCLFATNTSSFRITELAKAHPDPTRFFGLHFFYPAYQTSLVEIVRGEQTSDSTITSALYWTTRIGKIPFIVKDKPGFLIHRLFLPLMSEALWMLYEGASIPQIDQIYNSYGFSMGPFRLMDELGLDICLKLIKSFPSSELDLHFPKQALKIRPIFLGKKNKNGFYIYNNKLKVAGVNNLIYQDLNLKPSSKKISEPESLERGLYRMINESALVLEDQVVNTPAELDLALTLGVGFPAFRGGLLKYADEISLKSVIAGLKNFSERHGKRFHPSSALLKKAETGFYTLKGTSA